MNSIIDVAAVLITISAAFAYINHRFIGLPTTIGVMIIAMSMSLLIYLVGLFGFADFTEQVQEMLAEVDFDQTLLHGMLSFLLFAGALHVNLNDLREQKWLIFCLATFGVLTSTFIVGTASFYLLALLSCHMPYSYCLLFGALISPTDPIAAMATLKRLGVSKELETTIAGESLFNDGVGVVIFLVLLMLVQNPDSITPATVGVIFMQEAVGGVVFGILLGYCGYYLTRSIDSYKVEVLLTLALVMGGYGLATSLHVSGPIAIVVAGLMIGRVLRSDELSAQTRRSINEFWELIDEFLNVILFALIGLELLIIPFDGQWLLAGLLLILIVLASRAVSVCIPIHGFSLLASPRPHMVKILTWGGLRGGISVALALSLPVSEYRELILFLTYIIVVFSIIVQGLSLGAYIRHCSKDEQHGTERPT